MQICKENFFSIWGGVPPYLKVTILDHIGGKPCFSWCVKKNVSSFTLFFWGGVRTKSVKWLIVAIWLSWTLMACHDGWLSWMTFMDDFLGLILTTWARYIQMDLQTYLTDIGTCQVAIATENNDNLVVIFDLSPLIQKLRNILETFGLLYTSFTYWWP